MTESALLQPAAGSHVFRRILAATDFTPASKHAFLKASSLARALDAELHLLHVGFSPCSRSIFCMSIPAASRQAVSERLQRRTARRFEDFLRGEDLGRRGVVTAFREGQPHEEVVRYVRENGVDLVVVGERCETRIQHLIQHLAFESVGERVRREAPCPVLTVR